MNWTIKKEDQILLYQRINFPVQTIDINIDNEQKYELVCHILFEQMKTDPTFLVENLFNLPNIWVEHVALLTGRDLVKHVKFVIWMAKIRNSNILTEELVLKYLK